MAEMDRPSQAQAERIHKFAHDLKNRLSGLQEALRQMADPSADHKELLEFGEQQFFKALRNIEEFMDDLHIDRNVKDLAVAPVELAELVRLGAEQLHHRFSRKDQSLHLDLDPTIRVNADRHYLLEAIGALISNASKFSPRNGSVTVVLKKKDRYAELCITDNGVGLTEADLKQIFTRYAWLSSRSTAGEAQGRNALSRAHQWLRAMGGEMEASSEGTGKGCSFTLRLPLA